MAEVYYKNGSSFTKITAADVGVSTATHTHNYAGSSSAGGPASKIYVQSGTSAGARPVFFAYLGDNQQVVYNSNFTYEPSVGILVNPYHNVSGVGKDSFIAYPNGGQYTSTAATQTGMLKITLPVSWTNTMISFDVNIYNYANDTSVTYRIAGCNYSSGWTSTTAYNTAKNYSGKISNLGVRFGHDGSKCCVCIGETNTSWDYPQVSITNVLLGYSGDKTFATWSKNWSISFITTAPTTVNRTITNTGLTTYATSAGSASSATTATTASKLGTNAGSATQPVYFSGGVPVACTYTLGKSVPSNAVFTDTNTWIALKGSTTSAAGTAGYAPAPAAPAASGTAGDIYIQYS